MIEVIDTLVQIAKQAGKIILEVYTHDDFAINIKNDRSPLTTADKKSHTFISDELEKKFPGIPVISEEGKNIPFSVRKEWKEFFLVDPLDGTKEFIKRNGEFTVNIALIKNNLPVTGIIYVPVTGTCYYGVTAKGAWKKEINKSNNADFSVKRIAVGNKSVKDKLNVVQSRSHSGNEEEEYYSRFNIGERLSYGSSLKICMIAEGKADLYFRSGPTWEWDTAAGHAILNAAGGYLTNKDGSSLLYNKESLNNIGFIAGGLKIEF